VTPQLHSVAEVANLLSCTRQHIYNLISRGQLSTVHIGMGRAKTRISETELATYIKRHTTKEPAR
jgi:excisionase family DNA binding protein